MSSLVKYPFCPVSNGLLLLLSFKTKTSKFKLHFYLFQVCTHSGPIVHIQISEDKSWELVLTLHSVGLKDQMQIDRFGGRHLYLLSHLDGHLKKFSFMLDFFVVKFQ